MNEIKIEDYICEKLSLDEQKIVLDFVDYLEKEKFIFVKDNGYWKDKIYYLIKYKNEGICFIVIKYQKNRKIIGLYGQMIWIQNG